jgi:RHS repeat-associated protein
MHRRLSRIILLIAIILTIAAPAAAHNKIVLSLAETDLRDEIGAQERVQPLPIFVGSRIFDEVTHVELPSPSIADELAYRFGAHGVESSSELPIFAPTVSRKLASGPLAVFEENNLSEQSELGRELRRTAGNARARWYDPSTGSFLSPDPMGYQDSSNLYAFCGGDPVNCSDPTGMWGWNDVKKTAGNLVQFEIGRLKGKAQDAINTAIGIVKAPSAPIASAGTAIINAYTDASIVYSGYQANGIEGARAAAQQVADWNNAEAARKRKALVNLIPGVREYKHTKSSAIAMSQENYQLAGAEYAHAQTALSEDAAMVMAVGGVVVSTASKARAALSFESAAAAGAEGFTAGAVEGMQMLRPQFAQVSVNAQRGAAFEQQLLLEAQATQIDVATQLSVRSLGTWTRTKLDLVGRDPITGVVILTEGKSSATATLTAAQTAAFPDIAANGAVVIGRGKPGYPRGTVIVPTPVVIKRP